MKATVLIDNNPHPLSFDDNYSHNMPRIQQSYQSINNLINRPISEVLDIKKPIKKIGL